MPYLLDRYRQLRTRYDIPTAYRYARTELTPNPIAQTPRNPELGRALAVAVAVDDQDTILDLVRLARRPLQSRLLRRFDLRRCDDCGDVHHAVDINEHGICESCEDNYSACEHCGGRDTEFGTVDGECCCSSCVSDSYYWESDGERHFEPEPEPEPEDDLADYGTFGRQCRRRGGAPITGLADCGYELEVEVGDASDRCDFAERATNSTDLVCGVERDGSLDDERGAEIVTHYGPLTWVSEQTAKLTPILRKFGATSHDTDCCGLHISLSCGDCSTYEIAKYVVFWNLPENAAFLTVFARRWGEFYAMPKPTEKGLRVMPEESAKLAEVLSDRDRRELVNLQERHRGRLEVRAFRGTTRLETIRACLELAVLSLTYCRTESPTLRWQDFLRWLKSSDFVGYGQNLLTYWKNRKTLKGEE